MIVDKKTDKFKKCSCGHTPTKYSIGYGRTPYIFRCECGKQLNSAKCKITGSPNNMFDYWNKKLRHITLDEMETEEAEFEKEKEQAEEENYQQAKEYRYFWFADRGETLIQRW